MTRMGDFVSALACPTSLFDLSASLHTAALAMGHGPEDTVAMCTMLEMTAGLKR